MNTDEDQTSGGARTSPQDPQQGGGNSAGLGETAHDLKDKVGQLASEATTEGKARVEEYREVAATRVEKLAQSVKAAASELEGDDTGNMSRHIADLASGMQKLSQGLREKSGDELLRDVNGMARSNPGLFLAAGVAVGFGLTRLLRATAAGDSATSSASGRDDEQGVPADAADRFASDAGGDGPNAGGDDASGSSGGDLRTGVAYGNTAGGSPGATGSFGSGAVDSSNVGSAGSYQAGHASSTSDFSQADISGGAFQSPGAIPGDYGDATGDEGDARTPL